MRGYKGCNAGHFPAFGNILAVCDTHQTSLGHQGNSRYHWVPAAAGWTVGVIATLSLLASVSPLIRWIIKVPREFINDYLFNFPDTNFAWSFVLALLAAALTARKRIAWLVLLANMVLAAVVNAAEIAAGGNTAAESFGRISDSPCMLWQSSFWCWAIGSSGPRSAGARCFGRLRCGLPARWSESWRLGVWSNCFRDH